MSYLTFTQWTVTLNHNSCDVMVADGEGRELLQETDFIVTFDDKSVLVKNAKNERHTMMGVQLFGTSLE